jgi:hypothetical protein
VAIFGSCLRFLVSREILYAIRSDVAGLTCYACRRNEERRQRCVDLRIYLRVIALLAPEKALAITLALANLSLAGAYYLEPGLFGGVVMAD